MPCPKYRYAAMESTRYSNLVAGLHVQFSLAFGVVVLRLILMFSLLIISNIYKSLIHLITKLQGKVYIVVISGGEKGL